MTDIQEDLIREKKAVNLPVPTTRRWQPLRLGLVELFHYDSEEFWFKDGHLLLRGNNGTGKSKVLSLTMPFLLDANLKSSRIEPDGDGGKKMSWNLLMGAYERRIGYAWIEFGCLTATGEAQYVTLGAGMLATAAKPKPEPWYFTLDGAADSPRMNRDLWLTSPDRQVLTKEKLKDAILGHGLIYPTAEAYRRAVDERLFKLGAVRYDALIDTLIQLRQPQLSKKPDEAALSAALTQALPPIADLMLVDVADSLGKLEDERQTLEQYQSLSVAVKQFEQRYRAYAGTRTRREAKLLRQAQTDFDNASRAKNDSEERKAQAVDREAAAKAAETEADLALADSRRSWEVLKDDPANADATRLDRAAEQARKCKEELAEASKAVERARKAADVAETRLRDYATRVEALVKNADSFSSESVAAAMSAHLEVEVVENVLLVTGGSQLQTVEGAVFERERGALQNVAADRRKSVSLVRGLIADADRQRGNFEGRQQRRDEALDDLQDAREERASDEDRFDQEGRAHVEAWSDHLGRLRELSVDTEGVLAAVGDWVLNVPPEHPGRQALNDAHASALLNLSSEEAAIKAERGVAQAKLSELQSERKALVLGTDPEPPAPATRDPRARSKRLGAPLWKLVDFAESVPPEQHASLEAALEGSGILDAWVSTEGDIVAEKGVAAVLDTTLLARGQKASSLANWLVPVPSETATAQVAAVKRLLEGISCGESDTQDEAWIGLDGRFRVGPVSGRWQRSEASYIGATSRARARVRRIAEIDAQLDELSELLSSIASRIDAISGRKDAARSEVQSCPTESLVRTWHLKCISAIETERRAGVRFDQAERDLSEARDLLATSVKKLEQDAADLRLPVTSVGLAAIEDSLAAYEGKLAKFLDAAQTLRTLQPEFVLQEQRRDETRAGLEDALEKEFQRQEELTGAEAELRTLESTIGLQVQELRAELERLRLLVGSSEQAQTLARNESRNAGEARAIALQDFLNKQASLDAQAALRATAVTKLQQFAASGILAAGAPEIVVPDGVAPWTIEPALGLARRLEQALVHVSDADDAWNRVQKHINDDLSTLQTALSGLGYQCTGEQTDFGLVVSVVYQNRPERPDKLATLLDREIVDRSELLTNKEKEILEDHLQAEIASEVQRLLKMADDHVSAINEELKKHPTSTGVKFRLLWEPLSEAEGAPLGLPEARKRLLNKSSDLWSSEDRAVVGNMLQQRIRAERELAESGAQAGTSLSEQLARALDYRQWHRFKVERWQAGQWKKLSGPASSGERALGLTVPLFAAVASFYGRAEGALAPRLMLLDEAFAGIDDAARAHCMALIREFDLDFIITSEREWACYAELPGVSICQLQRREDVDAVFVSRWTWDGKAKKQQPDPDSRFPPRS